MGKESEDLDNSRLWKKEDAMRFLGVGRSKLYLLVARNEIPHLRIDGQLRFIPEQMWAWAKKKTAS